VNGHFTPRQAEIVALIASGLEDKEIARQLGVSVATVRTHLQRLYRQIGVPNRSVAAVRWMQSDGAIDLGSATSFAHR
jgi:DNA-binding CsgD family transcriptional regulator